MAIGIFGGTFDPIHIGHLRTALELREHLHLDAMHLMPCGDPVHRHAPLTSAVHRLAMVRLAVAREPGLVVDDREIVRGGASYTIDSLQEVRREQGSQQPLCLCIGMDSLLSLATWKRWRELSDVAHVVVAARPGWQPPREGEVAQWVAKRRVDNPATLHTRPAGAVYVTAMTLLPVAATSLRESLAAGHSIRYLTPDAVVDYIHTYQLYQRSPMASQEIQ
ncbi:MAG: nicotinate-nucleotide adenylyltransferase [Porticoccaceae bacterium]|nr:nicotinate-nucleotide adenylyltransferase [Porticoccaceae bacterium]